MVWLFLEVMCEEWRSDVMERKKTGVRQMYAKQEKQNKVKFLKELRDFKA